MSSYNISLNQHAKNLNLSIEITRKIVEKRLIPTQLVDDLYFTTNYGSRKLNKISELIDLGYGFPDIEKVIEN